MGWSSTTRILLFRGTVWFCALYPMLVSVFIFYSFMWMTVDRHLYWKGAGHAGPASSDTLYLERTANHPGRVVHQMTPHPRVVGWNVGNSATVIRDRKRTLFLVGGQ